MRGKGSACDFLQHVERTRVLAFLIPLDSPDPQRTYDSLREEIRRYSDVLAQKEHIVMLTKRDLLAPNDPIPALHAPEAEGTLAVSSAAGTGLEELKEYLWKFVEKAKETEAAAADVTHMPGYWEFMDDDMDDERLAYLALTQVSGMGPAQPPFSSRISRPHSAPIRRRSSLCAPCPDFPAPSPRR